MKKNNFYRFAILIGLVVGFLVIMSGCDKYEDDEFQLPASETLVIQDSYSALPNTSLLIDLNQGLRASQPVQVQTRIAPEKGVLTFMDVGMVLYEPHTNFTSGKDVFVIDIVASENGEVLDSDSVEVVMRESAADIPCFNGALTDRVTARRGDPIEINVIVNDGYCVGQTTGAIVELFAEPNHGQVELGDLFEFVYTSDSSFTGRDDFIYSLTLIDEEGNEYISRGLVIVDVVEEYEDPYCEEFELLMDTVFISREDFDTEDLSDAGVFIFPFENDRICDEALFEIFEIHVPPKFGEVEISDDQELFYRPSQFEESFVDEFGFLFSFGDEESVSESLVTVIYLAGEVQCEALPFAEPDEYVVSGNQDANGQVRLDILENDAICENLTNLEVEILSQPPSGFMVAEIIREKDDAGLTIDIWAKLQVTDILIAPPPVEEMVYRICDRNGNCSEAPVTLIYEDSVFCDGLPAANFDEYTIDVTNDALVELMNEGMLLDVLENDLICDRIENIELEITSQPASGFTVASIKSETSDNGKPYKFIKLEYTGIEIVPPEFETFSYRICDSGGNCSETDVLLNYKSDPSSGGVIIKSGVITSDEVWTNQNIYLLEGQVYVGPDVSLTIEPGTIIKGNNESSEAAALIISRDAMLFAEGTPDEPIIFTTVEDEIYPGAVKGSLSADEKGLWGGLYILGQAPISGNETSDYIDDLLPKNDLLEVGGNDPGHSSGILRYVSIRHTGATLSPGEESDGLFLGGVGEGTRIDHIEVYGCLDDGITFYGGNVNVTNSVVWSVDDDGYDIEQGYYGRLENFIYQGGQYSNNALEIDGPDGNGSEGFSLRYGSFNIEADDIAMLRDGASGLIEFCHFTGIPENAFLTIQDEATSENYFSGRLIIQENVFQLFDRSISDIVQDLSDSDRDQEFKARMSAENIVADDKAGVGVSNLEAFNWTVAAQIGILDKFY